MCGDSSAVVNVNGQISEFELSSDQFVWKIAVVTGDFDSTDYAMANGILPPALWSDGGTDLGKTHSQTLKTGTLSCKPSHCCTS